MKYLVVVIVVTVVLWLLIRGRARPPDSRRQPPAGPAPQVMAVCRHCGVHLPLADAVADKTGAFCTEAHRLAGPRPS